MGILSSKDTRRLSFDNTFAITPTIIQKSIEDSADIATDHFDKNTPCELNYKDTSNRFHDLRDGDHDYWVNRIESLKKDHLEINQIIEKEYKGTIETNNKLLEPPKITHEKLQKMRPCFDWQTKIMKCYEDNPRQSLVCSNVVQGFTNCVSSCQLED